MHPPFAPHLEDRDEEEAESLVRPEDRLARAPRHVLQSVAQVEEELERVAHALLVGQPRAAENVEREGLRLPEPTLEQAQPLGGRERGSERGRECVGEGVSE